MKRERLIHQLDFLELLRIFILLFIRDDLKYANDIVNTRNRSVSVALPSLEFDVKEFTGYSGIVKNI